jgi:hypothetical protein
MVYEMHIKSALAELIAANIRFRDAKVQLSEQRNVVKKYVENLRNEGVIIKELVGDNGKISIYNMDNEIEITVVDSDSLAVWMKKERRRNNKEAGNRPEMDPDVRYVISVGQNDYDKFIQMRDEFPSFLKEETKIMPKALSYISSRSIVDDDLNIIHTDVYGIPDGEIIPGIVGRMKDISFSIRHRIAKSEDN